MKRVLFVVDAQNDFMPNGALAVPFGDKIIPRVNELLKDKETNAIFFSKDWHGIDHTSFALNHKVDPFTIVGEEMKWPVHCLAGDVGAEVNDGIVMPVNVLGKAIIIAKGMDKDKEEYSALANQKAIDAFNTAITGTLAENDFKPIEVVFVGLATDYCVKATALDARKITEGNKLINIVVDLKGCRGVAQDTTEKAIKEMRDAGIEVRAE